MSRPEAKLPEAFVLVGGRSSRMGTDKASLVVDGQPMALWVAQALRPHACAVRFVGKHRPDFVADSDFVSDQTALVHPLCGVRAAMAAAQGEWVLLAPCDLVGLRPEHVAALLSVAGPVVAQGSDGVQPLLGRFPTAWADRVDGWIEESAPARSLAVDATSVFLDYQALRNINLPSDLDPIG
jgi:molybdopterin-guanine dinucleotide biosynthesis protein A